MPFKNAGMGDFVSRNYKRVAEVILIFDLLKFWPNRFLFCDPQIVVLCRWTHYDSTVIIYLATTEE